MNKHLLTSILGICAAFSAAAQYYAPVAVTGYNQDVIAESAPAISTTTAAIDGSDYVLYSQAYGTAMGTGTGLPNNGTITSGVRTYQLGAFNQPNAFSLLTGETDSLELATPASFAALSLLGFSTEGPGQILAVVKFTDGSAAVYNAQALPDWFDGGGIISGFDRTGRTGDTPDFSFSAPTMYAVNLVLTCADQAKLVRSVMIINTTSSPTIRTEIFALSGAGVLAATVNHEDISCNGLTDGSATALHNNTGFGPYTYSWSPSGGSLATASTLSAGTYTATITDSYGCTATGSATIVNPPVLAATTGSVSSTCHGGENGSAIVNATGGTGVYSYSWSPSGELTATAQELGAGSNTVTVTDANGCTVTPAAVNIAELAAATFSQSVILCQGQVLHVGTFTHTAGGTYSDVLQTANGCDSIVTSVLTITPVDVNVTVSGALLSSGALVAGFRWLNCTTGYSEITDAVAAEFTATVNGSHAVEVIQNGCLDTSACFAITTVSLAETAMAAFTVYPNPVADVVAIQFEGTLSAVAVIDLSGRKYAVVRNGMQLDVQSLQAGTYLVCVTDENGYTGTRQFVKL